MNKNIVLYTLLCFSLLSHNLQAKQKHGKVHAKDPIGWSIFPTSGFPAQTTNGSSYTVTYTLTNNLPFAVPLSVSGAYIGGKFSLTNGCNTTLQPQGTCQMHLVYHPIGARTHSAVLTMAYHYNRVPLPTQSSTSTSVETSDRISGHVSIPLPGPLYVGLSYPVTFTFINNGNTTVTTTAVNVSGFTASTNTCSSSLAEHSTCTVTGTYTPATTGQVTLGVTYVYSRGSVPLTTTSNVLPSTSPCHDISADAYLPLPSNTLIYADNVVEYVYTNHCPSTTETISGPVFSSDSSGVTAPTITPGNVTPLSPLVACGSTLAPSTSCAAFAAVVPNATYGSSNDLTVTGTLTYNNGTTVDVSSSETVSALSNNASQHYLLFVNQCLSQNVWYGFNPGGSPSDPTSNSTWQNYQLDIPVIGAAPGTQILQFPQYDGGNIFGRTGCETDSSQSNYGICQTGNCTVAGSSAGTCTYAPNSPVTLFEQNFEPKGTADGFYDISLINGFNLPGEFRSLSPYVAIAATGPDQPANFSNTCGNSAGAIIQPLGTALNICTWSFSPPSSGSTDCTSGTGTENTANYYNVSYGTSNDGCTPGSCSGTQVCGMSQSLNSSSAPTGTPIYRHCGTWEGYWTLADWINFSADSNWGTGSFCNLFSHYSMGTTLGITTYGYSTRFPNSNPMPAATYADMFGCVPTSQLTCYPNTGPKTCFNVPQDPYFALNTGYGNTYNVCGCHDWNNPSITPSTAQTGQNSQCTADNSLWESQVYNRILWLKEACPTAYSYQFDDKSSSFQCNVTGQLTSYQITFCPGGKTGAPGT